MKNEKLSEFLRKYSFYLAIGFLTVILVLIFRHKKLGEFVAEGKKGLASLYARDLKPMIYTNEITNEDVFNFAMFNSLPVNKKENRFLYLGQDSEGKSSISIHTADYKENTSNYRNFVEYLNLNQNQKKEFDSLLNHYKAKLYTAVWTDNKDAVAFNQNIPVIHDLIYLDIKHFAEKTNKNKTKEIYADRKDVFDPIEIKKVETDLMDTSIPQDFVIVSKDTLYKAHLSPEVPKVTVSAESQEAKWREEFAKSRFWANENRVNLIEQDKELNRKYAPSRHNNEIRVNLPVETWNKAMQKEISKLKELSKLQYIVSFDDAKREGKKIPGQFKMNFDINKLDSFLTKTVESAMYFVPKEEREKLKKEIDSAIAKSKLEIRKNIPPPPPDAYSKNKEKSRRPKTSDTSGALKK